MNMENMSEYRSCVSRETTNLFLSSFRKALKKVDKKKFSFISVVGSAIEKDLIHDIDIIVFPGVSVKLGESILEMAKLYDLTEKELKKHHKRYYLVTAPKFAMQEATYHLASTQEGSAGMVPIHSMFFANYRDFKKMSPKRFIERVLNDSHVIHGSLADVKKVPKLSQKKLEPYFFILDFEMNARIKKFPQHLTRASAEALFDYLHKKYGLNVDKNISHSLKGLEKEFRALIHELDKKTYG